MKTANGVENQMTKGVNLKKFPQNLKWKKGNF